MALGLDLVDCDGIVELLSNDGVTILHYNQFLFVQDLNYVLTLFECFFISV